MIALASILTSLIGPAFIVLMILLTLLGAKILVPPCVKSIAKNSTFKNVLNWIGVFLLAVLTLVVLSVGLWTLQQEIVNPVSNYNNATVQENIENAEYKTITEEEKQANKERIIDKPSKEKHEKALSDFEKAMEKEAEKIKKRNEIK